MPPETHHLLLKRARSAWYVMRKRCLNPRNPQWMAYGGAGIRICPQWGTFDQFLADMGLPPTPQHWLGRKDVRSHYVVSNCSWVLPEVQQRRRAFCHRVPLPDGQVLTVAEVARLPGMPGIGGVRGRHLKGFGVSPNQPRKLYRSSRWITWQGETLPSPEWARRLGIQPQTLWSRLRSMPLARAMTPGHFRKYPTRKKATHEQR